MAWSLSPSNYVEESVKNVETYMKENLREHWKIPKTAVILFPIRNEPTEDVIPKLEPKLASYYQYIISVLQWMVKLGQIDINTEILMLTSYLALPREGHLEAVFHVFLYLWAKHNSKLAFDPNYPEINHDSFKKHNWVEFYGNVKEAILNNMPEPRSRSVDLRMHVDSDHVREKKHANQGPGSLYL